MFDIAWSRDPVVGSVATGAPNIDLVGVHDYSELLLECVGLRWTDAAAPPATDVLVQFSLDGQNFDNADANYASIGAPNLIATPVANTPAPGIIVTTALPKDTTFGFRFIIVHWNAEREKFISARGGRANASTGQRYNTWLYKQPKKCKAIRLTNTLGYNWSTNNGVYVRQRQP